MFKRFAFNTSSLILECLLLLAFESEQTRCVRPNGFDGYGCLHPVSIS